VDVLVEDVVFGLRVDHLGRRDETPEAEVAVVGEVGPEQLRELEVRVDHVDLVAERAKAGGGLVERIGRKHDAVAATGAGDAGVEVAAVAVLVGDPDVRGTAGEVADATTQLIGSLAGDVPVEAET